MNIDKHNKLQNFCYHVMGTAEEIQELSLYLEAATIAKIHQFPLPRIKLKDRNFYLIWEYE